MKDQRQERLGRLQREYHRNHPWRLGQGGLFVPHSYAEVKQDALSWWDDVGFILNRRRVIVWWRHPRHVYRDAIEELAQEQTGEFPFDDWLTRGAIPNYRKVGRSRKKIVSYTCRPPSEASRAYFQRLRALEQEMSAQGIDCSVRPSSKRKCLSWATEPGWSWLRHWRCATNRSLPSWPIWPEACCWAEPRLSGNSPTIATTRRSGYPRQQPEHSHPLR